MQYIPSEIQMFSRKNGIFTNEGSHHFYNLNIIKMALSSKDYYKKRYILKRKFINGLGECLIWILAILKIVDLIGAALQFWQASSYANHSSSGYEKTYQVRTLEL